LLQALQSLADEIGAFVNWHSHSNARCRQLASPRYSQSAGLIRSAQISAK
jgi:hypothetical protein